MASCLCTPVLGGGHLSPAAAATSEGRGARSTGCLALPGPSRRGRSRRFVVGVICMASQEERATERNPLDFPMEWDRPRPGRRADIFPKFSPMKTPLPPPMPADPPMQDDEDEILEDEEYWEEEEGEEEEGEEPHQ